MQPNGKTTKSIDLENEEVKFIRKNCFRLNILYSLISCNINYFKFNDGNIFKFSLIGCIQLFSILKFVVLNILILSYCTCDDD